MALQIINNAYVQYQNAVNALVAITRAEGYEMNDREAAAIRFYNKSLSVIRQKIESTEESGDFMAWCERSDEAYRLYVLAEHFTHPTCLQRPRTDFEKQTLVCFEKIEFLTSAKALELYCKL